MNDQDLLKDVKAKAQAWTQAPHDEQTRHTVRTWLNTCDQDEDAREALIDAFYTDLSFGTGGLRGKMGPGTNRINATTIALATQGLANHLLRMHGAPTSGGLHTRAGDCVRIEDGQHAPVQPASSHLPHGTAQHDQPSALRMPSHVDAAAATGVRTMRSKICMSLHGACARRRRGSSSVRCELRCEAAGRLRSCPP